MNEGRIRPQIKEVINFLENLEGSKILLKKREYKRTYCQIAVLTRNPIIF